MGEDIGSSKISWGSLFCMRFMQAFESHVQNDGFGDWLRIQLLAWLYNCLTRNSEHMWDLHNDV